MRNSELTFKELTENLAFVKIIYNGKVIYNDYQEKFEDTNEETVEHLEQIQKEYANKKIYSMKITVVNFHHCILEIEGEK